MQNASKQGIVSGTKQPSGKSTMAQRAKPLRNVRAILATAAGLVLLVSIALGGLGWRLLEQEKSLQQQQARDALQGKANSIQTRFFSKIAETEARLRDLGSSLPADAAAPFGDGAVVVALKTGVQSQPAGQLLYLPRPLPAQPLDTSLFDEAKTNQFEFQSGDLKAAGAALTALAARHPAIRQEALFRLARVQMKNGQTADALATYARLRDEKAISPLETPYGLLSRIQRIELLKQSGQPALAQQEAAAAVASLDAGEWAMDKATYEYWYGIALELAGGAGQAPLRNPKLAVSEVVASLWEDWQQFGRSGSRSLTKQLVGPGPVPVMTIVNANPDRMVAVIYAGEALRQWIPDPSAAGEVSGVQVSLVGPDGKSLLGEDRPDASLRVERSLAPASLPWQLDITASASGAGGSLASERRNYLILILVMIVLMVALACYAMARGVLREAAVGQLQSDFVSAVSHEFRSPLTTLRQLTELLAEGRILDEGRRRQYFAVMQKETSRLHQLVEDLLDFGRMDAGRREYHMEPLDLCTLLRESVQQYRNEAGANGHSIEIAGGPGPLMVEADQEALRRVVRNLLENAVKYSPAADTVWVEADREGTAAVLRVKDHGIGIPPEEQKRIFEKFVRGDAAKRAAISGTGIGLAMVQEIVRVHHGEVDLSSEVGAGSTFVVRLPLSHAAGSRAVEEPQAVHGSAQ